MPFARVLFKAERARFLRAERHTPLPGGPGIDPLDITVGVPGAWLRRGRWLGNAHPARSRDARPGPNRVQPKAARGKPRRSAERRARPKRIAAATSPMRGARRARSIGRR